MGRKKTGRKRARSGRKNRGNPGFPCRTIGLTSEMIRFRRFLALTLVVAILMPLASSGVVQAQAQEEDEVERLMERMSSAAKVGQLFLVTFPGAELTEDALVVELIRDYHVGGVVLLPENDNVINEGDTPTQVATLISQLQEVAWAATQPVSGTLPGSEEEPASGPFVPLFVAVSHEGNGMPSTSIVNGTTSLPSEMALGATWNSAYAEAVGEIAGQELRALGINMLLGPSLDVLEDPRPKSAGDLGVRSFGGDPFWVGRMGQAYIQGVHEGGAGRVAVVAKHFPGLGASDRSLSEEVSTVQRTLEKLRQVDLAPFFAVAQADDPMARPDGVMVSHIRFRGLEGGRFVTTRPISVDSQVLQRLLGQPELASWREQGGVTVSDGLGVRALRRFYDPSEESFNSRRIAQDAFLAGNDLLLLSQFAPTADWADRVANIESTITFFRERYEQDPSFHELVDAAVARVLRLKLALYGGTFRLASAQPDVRRAGEQVGMYGEALSGIGRDAVTLLSPPSSDLVPAPPTPDDNIVIFTDGQQGQPCATCAPVPYVEPLLLYDMILRLYGPDATGQVNPSLMTNFTFDRLEEYMSAPSALPAPPVTAGEVVTTSQRHPVEVALESADWIIFAMLDPTDNGSQSEVVRRFLAERADALRNPHLVVLAYDAPYHLDATEISKLSAYYVAYSRIAPLVEASVRALFDEFAPVGTPPVSVTGINYDLLVQTSPDSDQTIALYYFVGEPPDLVTPEPTEESQQTPEPSRLEVGDELRLRTGLIVDHNGHQVPDGTPVQFIFTYPQEGLEHSTMVTTRDGVAETMITLGRTGQLDISVQADPVPRTIALQITIQEGEVAIVVPSTPTPTPTLVVPTSTSTTEPEPVLQETPTSTPSPVEVEEEPPVTREEAGLLDLVLALLGIAIAGGAGYYVVRLNNEPVSRALRLVLWCVICGAILYTAYVLRVPGASWLREQSGVWAAGWVALFGSVLPIIVARIGHQQKPPA
jgi:beta-N-acetylhexosaminidase